LRRPPATPAVEFMDYVTVGKVIRLGAHDVIVLDRGNPSMKVGEGLG